MNENRWDQIEKKLFEDLALYLFYKDFFEKYVKGVKKEALIMYIATTTLFVIPAILTIVLGIKFAEKIDDGIVQILVAIFSLLFLVVIAMMLYVKGDAQKQIERMKRMITSKMEMLCPVSEVIAMKDFMDARDENLHMEIKNLKDKKKYIVSPARKAILYFIRRINPENGYIEYTIVTRGFYSPFLTIMPNKKQYEMHVKLETFSLRTKAEKG